MPADSPEVTYEAFSLTPKHVEVITLVEGQAAGSGTDQAAVD